MWLAQIDNYKVFDGRFAIFGGHLYLETVLSNSENFDVDIIGCTIPKNDFGNDRELNHCDISSFGKSSEECMKIATHLPTMVHSGETKRLIFQFELPENWEALYGDEEVLRVYIYSRTHVLKYYGRFEYVNGETWIQNRIGELKRRRAIDERDFEKCQQERYSDEGD